MKYNISSVINELRNTCLTLESVVERHEILIQHLPEADKEKLNQVLFQCESCKMWLDRSELSDDNKNCEDCISLF